MPTLMLQGTVQSAPPGLLGFDVNQPLTAYDAQIFKNAGYDFCIRYVPRTAQLLKNNLTNAEAQHILDAGLALMPVQHVALPGWSPTAELGTAYGSFAATYAEDTVGLPSGVNLWCDLEGVAGGTNPQNVIDYCEAWYDAVLDAGYVPGIYVGYDTRLTPQQLYEDLSFEHYWRAYNGPDVDIRGYQMLQQTQKTIGGITFDPNLTQEDEQGGAVLWLLPL